MYEVRAPRSGWEAARNARPTAMAKGRGSKHHAVMASATQSSIMAASVAGSDERNHLTSCTRV